MSEKTIGRRQFLSYTAALGATGMVAPSLLSSCSGGKKLVPLRKSGEYYIPGLEDKAIEGRELKVGVIGCGGRGSGAIMNLLEAADGIKVTGLCDVFEDKIAKLKEKLSKEAGQEVPADKCYTGFEGYKSLIDSGIDMVIIATPPVFRPYHFQYATEKGIHSFLEKPIEVDPKGYRTIMATAKQALAKNLSVVTGTQRRHQRPYVAAFEKIQQGLIGEITGGNVYWNTGMLWYKERQPNWSDMEWMIRDWVNWEWLSGDHIVEQHVHNIDVFRWMTGLKPVSATGFGARHRRITGDQYDMFSVDFKFENGIHLHSMCRQIDGCDKNVSEEIHGTKGTWRSATHDIIDLQGNVIWNFDEEASKAEFAQHNPYVLEHVDWVNHIRRGEAHCEAEETAISTLMAIMGRESAYSGKEVTWDEISASPLDLLPETLAVGPMDMSKYKVHVPGAVIEKKKKK